MSPSALRKPGSQYHLLYQLNYESIDGITEVQIVLIWFVPYLLLMFCPQISH